jgi:two-component system, LytTR family, sensor kinase
LTRVPAGRIVVPVTRAHSASPRLIIGVATALGLFSGFQAVQFVSLFSERQTSIFTLLGLNLSYWYAWALLVPVVLWMARRFPLERARLRTSIPAHAAAVIVVTLAHVTLAQVAYMLIMPEHPEAASHSWLERVARNYVLNFDWEMMTYWAIIGFSHAVSYARQAQDRTVRASQLEARLAEAQLQALQRQLHPHFLFNTLNAISALMRRDVDAADEMLLKLSELLRMALEQRGAQEVTLSDELDFLGKYLAIEQARFGDRLAVHVDVAPETLDALVPNLVLQPLVENGIRHAVATRAAGGRIEVRAAHEGDELVLQVIDDGQGLPGGLPPAGGPGVGLANTRSRLEHMYGAAHRLQFSTPAGGGLAVTVAFPFRREIPAAAAARGAAPAAVEGVA